MRNIKKTSLILQKFTDNLVHLGYSEKNRNAANLSFIITTKQRFDIINTLESLTPFQKTLHLVTNIVSKKGKVLIHLNELDKEQEKIKLSKNLRQSFSFSKWPHGIISNYKRLGLVAEKIKLTRIPNFVFIAASGNLNLVIENEIKTAGIAFASVASTNVNSKGIMYKIPGNSSSKVSLNFYKTTLVRAIIKGRHKEVLSFAKRKKLKIS